MRIIIDILAVIGALTVSSVVILVIALIFDACDQDDFDD